MTYDEENVFARILREELPYEKGEARLIVWIVFAIFGFGIWGVCYHRM